MAGERGIDPAAARELRKEYGFDQPVLVQYGIYIGRVLQRRSRHVDRHAGAGDGASSCTLFPATVELAVCAILFALLLGMPPASSPRCGATRCSTTA